ncbi:MAG TPA: hypothetical protein VHU81_21065 [Thermoanaerobaculia bacterium]|jgi:hypothetical protein|nr:hypothetical protein [Thermoanaerobaculia bacterium]
MPAFSKIVRGTEVCTAHNINIKFCQKCQAAIAEKNKPSINERILAVLGDGLWHTQREIASLTGLDKRETSYVDIGRDIRSLRTKENGEHPIDCRQSGDDALVYEYRLLTADEAPAFWAKRADRLPAVKLAEKDEEITFLKEYIATLEAEIAAMRLAAVSVPVTVEAKAS